MKPILRYPGAKWQLANKILPLIPEHNCYLEPYFGSGAIFFNKKPSKIEIINDINSEVYNLFWVMRNKSSEIKELLKYTPYSREEFRSCYEKGKNKLERARNFFVLCWQGYGAGQVHSTGWRRNICKGGSNATKDFKQAIDNIDIICDRLKDTQIENKNAIELIRTCNNPDYFIFIDPPYPADLRKKYLYKHDDIEHEELLDEAIKSKAKIMMCSYYNQLYRSALQDWHKYEMKGTSQYGIRTEVIWINYNPKSMQMTIEQNDIK